MNQKIPFNKPCLVGNEIKYINDSIKKGWISGDGIYTKKTQLILENKFDIKKVFLTTSCTHALEMTSILINLQPGDEVIVPSYTFVSTVNAFVLRGAKPVFIDIRKDTLNIDENKIEEKITDRTKAIFPVHYAGVGCEMNVIIDIAKRYGLYIVEDAAQGIDAKYREKYLGTLGNFGAYSFHETKICICGEGGALLINDEKFIERAEIIREKGTNRSKFFRGETDKYRWVDLGSSYLIGDILAAFLYAQLEQMENIRRKRRKIYDYYYANLGEFQNDGKITLPIIPENCTPNYQMFYIILPDEQKRNALMNFLNKNGVMAIFHYIPLHNSPMGLKFGYKQGDLPITEDLSGRILRLPFYNDLKEKHQEYIVSKIAEYLNSQE